MLVTRKRLHYNLLQSETTQTFNKNPLQKPVTTSQRNSQRKHENLHRIFRTETKTQHYHNAFSNFATKTSMHLKNG